MSGNLVYQETGDKKLSVVTLAFGHLGTSAHAQSFHVPTTCDCKNFKQILYMY